MRSLQRRKQDVWFVHRERDDSQLDQIYTYDKPVHKRFSVSPTSGNPMESYYGSVPTYDRYIVCYEHDYVPKEGTLVYVDRIPELDATTGELVIGEDRAPTVLPDYVVAKNARTKKGVVVRIGIKKQSGDDEEEEPTPTPTPDPEPTPDPDPEPEPGPDDPDDDEEDGGSLG